MGVRGYRERELRLRRLARPLRHATAGLVGLCVSVAVGIGIEEGRAFPYLAWSFPVAYHFEAPQLRKHPYGARDVLGVRVSPTIVLSFRDRAPGVMYGGAVGMSFW